MIVDKFRKKAEGIVDAFKEDLRGVRANRPSTSLVEGITVEYYDEQTPIEQVASISVSPPREIVIKVWDEEAVKPVVRAIEKSDLDLSPNIDDQNVIHLYLPELSKERREELVVHIKKKMEEYRIRIRKIRDEVNKQIENQFEGDEITEDNKFRLKDEVQEITEDANNKLQKLFEDKKKSINS